MAMLYLRFICPPEEMWDWFEPYLIDDHEIPIHYNGKKVLLAHLVKMLIEEQKFCGLLLPRIPILIHRQMKENLASCKLPASNDRPKSTKSEGKRPRRDIEDRNTSPPRKRRRSRSPDYSRSKRGSSRDRYDRRSRDRYDRDGGRDRYDRDSSRYDDRDRYDRHRGRDRYDDRERRDSRDRDRGRYDDRDRYDRDRYDRRDSRRDRDEERYDRNRRNSKDEEEKNDQYKEDNDRNGGEEIKNSSIEDQQTKNANLEKLKALYGSNQSQSRKSAGGYGDSLGEDVVRIGF